MKLDKVSTFSPIDYCFFVAMLLVSLGIGVFATYRGNKSPEEFLLGNRSFNPVPVAMSLLTSFISAISILGFSGETYAYGMQIIWFILGVMLGIGTASIIILPVIHPLKLTSINEYLDLRFNSVKLSKFVTLITSLQGIFYMGTALYAPTLALAAVTHLSSLTYIFIVGGVVTLYSSIGGIRAVIWTDVFQLTVMLIGLLVVVGVGFYELGGFLAVWNTAMEGGRLEIFDLNPSPFARHTLWNTIWFGYFLCFAFFGVSQINTQRLCAVASQEDAHNVLRLNIVGMALMYGLIFIGGILSYVAYAQCDPWKLGILEKKEEIMPYFIVDRLNFIPGLPGIFVATIIGGALSSLSSSLNSVTAMIWKDCLSHLEILKDIKPITAGLINKILSFILGGIAIGAAVLSTKATNLVQFSLTLAGATLGPILGIFLLGLLFPKTNAKGAWAGLIAASLLNGWISIGSFLYKTAPETLPLSIENCSLVSFNISNFDGDKGVYQLSNSTNSTEENAGTEVDEFSLQMLYEISYTLYTSIGTLFCIFVGVIVSCCTGNQNLNDISPKYVTPFVRRLWWEKEDLEKAELRDKQAPKISGVGETYKQTCFTLSLRGKYNISA